MLKLPRTLPEFLSPQGQTAIFEAEKLLNALQNTIIVVVDATGREQRVPLVFAGTSAIARIKL